MTDTKGELEARSGCMAVLVGAPNVVNCGDDGEFCEVCELMDRAASELRELRELISDCQDWLCEGDFSTKRHAERMRRINTALDAARQAGEGPVCHCGEPMDDHRSDTHAAGDVTADTKVR